MKAKLTLTIDEYIISKAKLFAEDQSISLSEIIENYLKAITIGSDVEVEQFSSVLSTYEGSYEML